MYEHKQMEAGFQEAVLGLCCHQETKRNASMVRKEVSYDYGQWVNDSCPNYSALWNRMSLAGIFSQLRLTKAREGVICKHTRVCTQRHTYTHTNHIAVRNWAFVSPHPLFFTVLEAVGFWIWSPTGKKSIAWTSQREWRSYLRWCPWAPSLCCLGNKALFTQTIDLSRGYRGFKGKHTLSYLGLMWGQSGTPWDKLGALVVQ